MSRKHEYGDIALVKYKDAWENRIYGRYHENDIWQGANGAISIYSAEDVQPLVVINPDNGSQVAAFVAIYHNLGGSKYDDGLFARLRQALKEYANPTPLEPDDPACRVWANGYTWARIGSRWVSSAASFSTWSELVKLNDLKILP